MTATDDWLDVAGAAERAGVSPGTWRSYVSRGYAPPADDPDEGTPYQRRRPRWQATTVDAYLAGRSGQGTRTDLIADRAERRRRLASEMVDLGGASADRVLQDWLDRRHLAVLAAAETLVDHRETLLATVPSEVRIQLSEAIDIAGERLSRRPSRTLAGALAYALFLVRPNGAASLQGLGELADVLAQHQLLRYEYDTLRKRISPPC